MASRNFALLLAVLASAGCYRSGRPSSSGSGGSTAVSPRVTGLARYYDADRLGTPNAGDRIVVPFNANVTANTSDASALAHAVAGDQFGTGATLTNGPVGNELTVVLGDGAQLKTRQAFLASQTTVNSASGIDVSPTILEGSITNTQTGVTAAAGLPIDIVPGFIMGPSNPSAPGGAIAYVDLNGDGILDLVTTRASDGFEIWIGDGQGSFQAGGTVNGGSTISIATADVNNDGAVDVILGTDGSDLVWYGNGDGSFSAVFTLPLMEPTLGLATADMDCDGDIDILAAGLDGLRLHLNDGDGQFNSEPRSYGMGSRAVEVADFDQDGDTDVLSAEAGSTQLWLNDSLGELSAGATIGTATANALALADINQDGSLDFVAGTDGPDTLWIGNGAGLFDSAGSLLAENTHAVEFSDIDQDGKPDLFIGGDSGIGVWFNRNGSFVRSEQLETGAVTSMVIADWDRDGDEDLAAVGMAGTTRVYESSLSGTWGTSTLVAGSDVIAFGETFSMANGDIDHDGDLDLVMGRDGFVEVFDNLREQLFDEEAQRVSFLSGDATDVAFVDVDADGDMDLLLTRREGLVVLINTGAGDFLPEQPPASSPSLSAFSVALDFGDVDNDGDIDVVVGNLSGADTVRLNPGCDATGWLGFPVVTRLPNNVATPPHTKTTDIALSDLDGDGDLDLILTQADQGPALIYRNDGSGLFNDLGDQLDTGGAQSLAVADLDKDGDPDLVIGTETEGVRPWINNGTGDFTAGPALSAGNIHRVVLRDLDGDGYPELVALRGPQGGLTPSLQIWHNTLGLFTESATTFASPGARSMTFGDFDLDGDTDMFLGFEPEELSSIPWWNE